MKDVLQLDEKLNYTQSLSKPSIKSPNLSEYYSEYSQTFKNPSLSTNKESLIKILLSNGIEYSTMAKDYIFGVRVIRYTPNYEIICLKIEYGPFSFECNILNAQQKSIVHSLSQIKSSEGCCIYLEPSCLNNTVIKCFPIKQGIIFQQLLTKVLKQYSIFKIASCLDIGPRLSELRSFQIIVYEDCIEFMMEKCQISQKLSEKYFQENYWDKLNEKLYKLHLLQIVHMDIKSSNICFSPSMNEFVFIDYGLSNIIEEKMGFKTETRFAGSLNFCSPDMKECYSSQVARQIDLYHNDLYGLKASFNELSKDGIEPQCSDSDESIEDIEFGNKNITEMTKNSIKIKMNLFRLKNLIYTGQIDQIMKNELYKMYLIDYFQVFLEFIYHLPYGISIEKIHKFIQNSKKIQTEYILIKKHSVQNYSIFKLESNEHCEKKRKFKQFFKGIYLSKVDFDNNKFARQTNDNIKLLVFNAKNIKNLKKTVYFQRLAQFISLKLFLSTFSEKITAIRILNKIYQINLNENDDDIKILKKGSLYLLEYFIEEQTLSFKRQIPLLFFNLIIYEKSREFIERLFIKIAKKQMKIQDCQFIILKCYNCSFWYQQYNLQSKQSKQLIDRILQICKQTFRNKLKLTNKQDKYYQSLSYTYQIVNYYQCHCVPYILNEKSSRLHQIKQIDEQLRHQIIIYIQSMLIEENQCTRKMMSNNTIDKVTLINRTSLQFNKKQLEYFHCLIFKFFRSSNNNKGMTAILTKIQKYFGTNILVESLYLHQQYVQRQFYYSNKNRKPYLLSLLKKIETDPTDQQARLILFYAPVSLLQNSHKVKHLDEETIELMKTIRRHMMGIFKIMPRQQIGQFIVKHKNMKDYQQWYLEYIKIMIELYQKEPKFPSFFKDFLQIFEQITKRNKCKVCLQHLQQILLISKIQYLKYTKGYQQSLILLDFCLQDRSKVWRKKIILTCIFDMVSFLQTNIPMAEQLEKRVSNVIKWISINNSWQEMLYKPIEQIQDFNIVYQYLLKNEMYECFCLVQVRLTQVLGKYPSRQMMLMYSKSLLSAYYYWSTQISALAVYVSTHQLFRKTEEINQYYAVFLSYLLIFKSIQDTHENRLILFIIKNINKLNAMGKEIVIKNIMLYFTKFSFVNYKEGKEKRKARKIWKMYFKAPFIQANLQELQRHYFNNIKNKKIPKFIKKIIHKKLTQFQEKIRFKEEHKCELLDHLFISPFYEQ